jgi:hypothetical protein
LHRTYFNQNAFTVERLLNHGPASIETIAKTKKGLFQYL